MALFLGIASFVFFALGFPAPELFLRLGLAATLRFSPRASLALSGVAALCGALAALCRRGGLSAAPAPARERLLPASFLGGALGRALLLMFTARFTGSLPLLRLQAGPLLLLCLASLAPRGAGWAKRRRPRPALFSLLCFACGAVDGFFGAGGALLLGGLFPENIVRRRFSSPALPLLAAVAAQSGALLLTALSGAAQVFPARMALSLAAGAALGALCAEAQGARGALRRAAANALRAYLVLCALAGIEQAAMA